MPIYVSSGGTLRELKECACSTGGQLDSIAKMYVSTGSALSEIFGGNLVGKKWMYTVHNSYADNGYITKIDPDTMSVVKKWGLGDLVYRGADGAAKLVHDNYDAYGCVYMTTLNRVDGVRTNYTIKRDKDGERANFPKTELCQTIDGQTLDLFAERNPGRDYLRMLQKYVTLDGGISYSLAYDATIPSSVVTTMIGHVISTNNYHYVFVARKDTSEGSVKIYDYRKVCRFDRLTGKRTLIYNPSGSSQRQDDYNPILPHPTLIDHFYSVGLQMGKGMAGAYPTNIFHLRNADGEIIQSLTMPASPSLLRMVDNSIFGVFGGQILRIELDLSSYTVLCNCGAVNFLDEEFYLSIEGGYTVKKYSYHGDLIGTITLDYTQYPSNSGNYFKISGVLCSHPTKE